MPTLDIVGRFYTPTMNSFEKNPLLTGARQPGFSNVMFQTSADYDHLADVLLKHIK